MVSPSCCILSLSVSSGCSGLSYTDVRTDSGERSMNMFADFPWVILTQKLSLLDSELSNPDHYSFNREQGIDLMYP